MQGNLHVRFGEGDGETCSGNGARRFIPTLPRKNPSRSHSLSRLRRQPWKIGIRDLQNKPTNGIARDGSRTRQRADIGAPDYDRPHIADDDQSKKLSPMTVFLSLRRETRFWLIKDAAIQDAYSVNIAQSEGA